MKSPDYMVCVPVAVSFVLSSLCCTSDCPTFCSFDHALEYSAQPLWLAATDWCNTGNKW